MITSLTGLSLMFSCIGGGKTAVIYFYLYIIVCLNTNQIIYLFDIFRKLITAFLVFIKSSCDILLLLLLLVIYLSDILFILKLLFFFFSFNNFFFFLSLSLSLLHFKINQSGETCQLIIILQTI